LYGPLVIVSADNKGGGAIAGLERATGKVVWKHQRPKTPNYASPIILNVAGRDQLLFTGCDRVASYEPLTGKESWQIKGSTTECVTSTVTDGQRIITSGGYPKKHVAAVLADGSGKVAWENSTRVYVPSMVAHKGHLYAVLDAGVAVCWKCDSGKEVWRRRLGGAFTASLVLVGEQIFATSESGQTFIFKATPAGYEQVGKNQLGEEVLASPAICAGRIYFRVANQEKGRRQEMLYCVGTPHADAPVLRKIAALAAGARLDREHFDAATRKEINALVASLKDARVRADMEKLVPALEKGAARHGRDKRLLAEIKRLGGKATLENVAPDWLRLVAGDEGLAVFDRLVEVYLNERTDGHKAPEPRKLADRVTDDFLKGLAGQDRLRRLELSGTAVTSAGLVHLKELKTLQWLNVCLTSVDDRGFEHLAGMTDMRRMVICASKITGTGFKHLQG
jgi:hypothetical protein